MNDKDKEFEKYSKLVFSIAYQMLGSVSDAEDIVQECFLKWRNISTSIQYPKSYITTIATRLCIDLLRNLSRRRKYVGTWLPEPIIEDAYELVDYQDQTTDSFQIATLLLLEKLTPHERAVFVLREAFDCSYHEIGEFTGLSEVNCRQILSRSKRKLNKSQSKNKVDDQNRSEFIKKFIDAIRNQNIDQLKTLLSQDIAYYADGGGKVKGAALNVIYHPERVATFILSVLNKITPENQEIKLQYVNNQLNIVGYVDHQVRIVICLEIEQKKIENIFVIANPDKLKNISRFKN